MPSDRFDEQGNFVQPPIEHARLRAAKQAGLPSNPASVCLYPRRDPTTACGYAHTIPTPKDTANDDRR